MSSSPLARLHDFGQSFWWDALSRRAIEDGTIARLRDEDGMRGITSNPSIFQQAIAEGDDYDTPLAGLLAEGLEPEAAFWELAVRDIRDACDLLAPVHQSSDGADGFVSLEVNPHFAFRTADTVAQARELWGRVERPNLMIKIPGTPECIPAIRECLADGIHINVTLLFSLDAHIAVMEAYLQALEQRKDQGLDLAAVSSVASFFVSRVDSLVDAKLAELEQTELQGRAGVANAKLAYANYEQVFSGGRWEALAAAGARVQRPLWASTSVKNPAYDPLLYVESLIGPDTVNTLPTVTVDAYRTQGNPGADRVRHGVDEARTHLAALDRAGIRMEEVTAQLLAEGVEKFADAFDGLLRDLESKADRLDPTRGTAR